MIFVSDLHMGGGGDDDDFSPEAEEAYLRLMEFYKESCHWIIGDGLELWQATFEEITVAHTRVFEGWMALPFPGRGHILGNHDLEIPGFERKILTVGYDTGKSDDRVLLIHGHQFDAANKSGNGLGKYVTQVVGFLERYVHKDVDDWLDRLYGIVKKRASEYDQGMADLAKENDCGIVVYGHTHFPAVKNVDGITVANCGCWTHRFENGYPYVKIGCNGVVSLKWWE